MKVVKNADGTVTVSIPKSDELYDPARGGLHVAETLSAEDFAHALKEPKAGATEGPVPSDAEKAKAIEDEKSRLDAVAQAERDRHAADAAANQLAVDRAQSQAVNDQRIASEKARLSLAANARIARDREDAALAGAPFTRDGTGAEKASADLHAVAESVGTKDDKRPSQAELDAVADKEAAKSRALTAAHADATAAKPATKPASKRRPSAKGKAAADAKAKADAEPKAATATSTPVTSTTTGYPGR